MVKSSVMSNESSARLEQLGTLIELATLINSSLEIAEIRKRAIEAATRLTNTEAGSLLFLDEATGELYFDVALGEHGEKVKTVRLQKGQGIAGWVAERVEPALINDVKSDGRFYSSVDHKSGFATRNMICVPVKTRQRLHGVLQVMNKRASDFDGGDLELVTALSNQVAVAIENARLFDELRETFYAIVNSLAETIEKRDPYTRGHTNRVMKYSLAIGNALGLTKGEMERLELAAILHDIGKIGIRDNVLLKNERLTPEEFDIIQGHVLYGAQILEHIKQLNDVVPGVKYHHEKFDGTGYPERLQGADIPLAARIIAVADTFDAMVTDRPYRKGLSFQTAFDELKRCAGTQFDAQAVDAFLEAYGKGEIQNEEG